MPRPPAHRLQLRPGGTIDDESQCEQTENEPAESFDAAERVIVDSAWFDWVQTEAQQALRCEATLFEIHGADPAGDNPSDPFATDLLLTGHSASGREVGVWLRLTPTVITDLNVRLEGVLHDQRAALGAEPETRDDTDDAVVNGPAEDRIRRFTDPLGVRHLALNSTTKTPAIIAAGIVALVLLAVILRMMS